jgi:hypothetical protein
LVALRERVWSAPTLDRGPADVGGHEADRDLSVQALVDVFPEVPADGAERGEAFAGAVRNTSSLSD